MAYRHVPAMPAEVLHYLNCRAGGIYVDGTLGGCGHARAICDRMLPAGLLIGIDQDNDAVEHGRTALKAYADNVRLIHGNFVRLPEFLSELAIPAVDGILLDLGLAQHHLEDSGRGFSFNKDEPLDMRMNVEAKTTAAHIVNNWHVDDLTRIFRDYGEERRARKIAKAIVQARSQRLMASSKELGELVYRCTPPAEARKQKIHPATRVFQALRIAVNCELDRLQRTLPRAVACLNPGGRLCVLSFHSLEDRIVKQTFREMARDCNCPPKAPVCTCGGKAQVKLLTRRVVRPSTEEVAANPMARSTRLRAVEKR